MPELPGPREIVAHPLSIISGAIGVVSYLFQVPFIDPLAMTVWNNASSVLALVTVTGTQLAPRIPSLPNDWTVAIIIAGTMYALKIVVGLARDYLQNSEDTQS